MTLQELTWIHTHKTAKLLEVSVATGALLGGANGRDVKQSAPAWQVARRGASRRGRELYVSFLRLSFLSRSSARSA